MGDGKSLAWDLFVELRKELVELQKIRAQVIGFKITFVSAGVALIAANLEKVPALLFVVPALAAIFFDLLVHTYSFSIKRTGYYCRWHLEPILRKQHDFAVEHPLWEKWMVSEDAGKNVSFWGNLGITSLALIPAVLALLIPFRPAVSVPLLGCVVVLLAYDAWALYKPSRFTNPPKGHSRNEVAASGPDAAPDSHVHTSPKPCVAALIVRDGPTLLLARRAVDPAKGKWDIPGGFIDPGESAEQAVAREIEEETSLKVMSVEYLGSVPDVYGDHGTPTLNLAFRTKVSEGEPTAKDDVASLHWVRLDQLPPDSQMAFAHQPRILQWCREYVANQGRRRGESLGAGDA